MHDYSTELAFALDVARRGGRVAMSHFGRNPEARQKDDGSWVTEADWAVESQIRLRIARTFPDHNILGEEEGLTAAGGGEPHPEAPTWIVDPIDGTNNYMRGIPIWATLVALRVGEESVVGVAHAPALDETYDAAVQLGARMNGQTIEVDRTESLSEAMFVFADAQSFVKYGIGDVFDELRERTYRNRGFGDFWGHMLVARGAAHVMIEPSLKLWDVAALQPIVTEAGGSISRLDGNPWVDAGGCVTTNGVLHQEVVTLLAERGDLREKGAR
ncbi:MAG: histidinol phosphatase [Actinomycetota bacterium]|nr:histidinol phosphatase [Actinomycetota bacterium]